MTVVPVADDVGIGARDVFVADGTEAPVCVEGDVDDVGIDDCCLTRAGTVDVAAPAAPLNDVDAVVWRPRGLDDNNDVFGAERDEEKCGVCASACLAAVARCSVTESSLVTLLGLSTSSSEVMMRCPRPVSHCSGIGGWMDGWMNGRRNKYTLAQIKSSKD
jgi:hypothetical protein